MTNKILVVDDDTRLRDLLTKYLGENGFFVSSAKDAFEAEEKIKSEEFDLLVVDIMMPGKSGIEFTKSVRQNNNIPILMLTAIGEVKNRVEGLESGADDYLQKPFEPKELLLRINNILKRTQKKKVTDDSCVFGNFEFDFKNNKLTKNGKFIYLTEAEAEILGIFCKNINKPLTREQLSEQLNNIDERSIDVQITRIRKKIEEDSKKPQYLQTKRGSGYNLQSIE
jgi:two-component system phosphate regulon response regulator OmpR